MRKTSVFIAVGVGIALGTGVVAGTRVAAVSAAPRDCSVAKSLGTFRAVTSESWLLFEDETGTLRAVDYSCQVQRVISRR